MTDTTTNTGRGTRGITLAAAVFALAALTFGVNGLAQPQTAPPTAVPDSVRDAVAQLKALQARDAAAAKNIANFDTLDFDVYSNQRWDRLKESHTDNIIVHYPDGRTTTGLDAHIAQLKPQFVFAPDTRVVDHPVKIGSGDWTAVIGRGRGTFTQPMPIGPGKFIQPTGKTFDFEMVTIGHWNKDGLMDEEWLFWDTASVAKQLGIRASDREAQ